METLGARPQRQQAVIRQSLGNIYVMKPYVEGVVTSSGAVDTCPVFCVPHQVPEDVVQPSRLLPLFLDVFNLYQLSGLCC